MKYHVYIWLEALSRQLATSIELPDNALDLSNSELNGLIRTQVDPFAQGSAYKDYRIDGLREHGTLPPPPPPAWLGYEETKNAFPSHHPILGDHLHYQWSEFLGSLLGTTWASTRDWTVGPDGLGHPTSKVHAEEGYIPYRKARVPLVNEVFAPWLLMPNMGHGHLGLCHPFIAMPSLARFIAPRSGRPIFPVKTHPSFYVALYEFWVYLQGLPLWAHLPSNSIVTDNRSDSTWTPQTMLCLGATASTFRWGWWSMVNHAFPAHSRALDILLQHYPNAYSEGTINPSPAGMELSPEFCTFPPKLRIFIDPLGR